MRRKEVAKQKENDIMEMAQETRNTDELLSADINLVKCILPIRELKDCYHEE